MRQDIAADRYSDEATEQEGQCLLPGGGGEGQVLAQQEHGEGLRNDTEREQQRDHGEGRQDPEQHTRHGGEGESAQAADEARQCQDEDRRGEYLALRQVGQKFGGEAGHVPSFPSRFRAAPRAWAGWRDGMKMSVNWTTNAQNCAQLGPLPHELCGLPQIRLICRRTSPPTAFPCDLGPCRVNLPAQETSKKQPAGAAP